MSDHWETEADVLADWLSLARRPGQSTLSKPPTRITEHMRKARGRPSIYDDDYDKEREPEVRYCAPSRGRPLGERNPPRPGKVASTQREFRNEVQKQIRQVSGLGYSNELIEHVYKNEPDDDKEEKEGATSRKRNEVKRSGEVEYAPEFPQLGRLNVSSMADFPPLK